MAAFLKAFDCSNPVELHDYAVARYLLDLGLRDDEVAHLTLQLVDWRNGTLTLECVQKLPLPVPTGGAIARYLRQGRPTDRNPFVRHRASADIPLSVAAIRNSMNRSFIRCGLRDQLCNTHVCAVPRRPVCSAQGRRSSPLHHRGIETASAYARVGLEGLRAVALLWPGSRT